MKKYFLLLTILLFNVFVLVNGQKKEADPVLLTIDGQPTIKSEFLRIYNKNNSQQGNITGVKEYLDLYINYKLKVIEAEHLGYDTVSSFVKEFNSYKDQLAKPYLNDNDYEDQLVKDAFERMKFDIHARQIHVKCDEFALPSDTLAAYNKALSLRNRLIKGEPWDSIVNLSDDPTAKKNKGDVGFFTASQMLYPFELAAYRTKVNEYSMPVRTKVGYFIIQPLEKRPSRGEVKVAHIMVSFPEDADKAAKDSAKSKIGMIYNKLKAGEKFEDLAKEYSDDKRTAVKGGELNWFIVGQMIPEFQEAAFGLMNNGDISEPIRTTFGWHILKKIDQRQLKSSDDYKNLIKSKFGRDERSKAGQVSLVTML
jgi:peptidyl-prolyl cis-trans isomerase SurA